MTFDFGYKICVDARIIKCHILTVKESILINKSINVSKIENKQNKKVLSI